MVSILKFIAYILLGTNLIANVLLAATPLATGLSSELCLVVSDVRTVVGIFALLLFMIGGLLYASAGFITSVGSQFSRGNLHGWAMGMVIGGIVGLIIVIAALPIVTTIAGFGTAITAPSCGVNPT